MTKYWDSETEKLLDAPKVKVAPAQQEEAVPEAKPEKKKSTRKTSTD